MSSHAELTVGEFVRDAPSSLELRLQAGASGLVTHRITLARIQKLGLALAGFADYIHAGRIQIVGQSEITYLEQLSTQKRRAALTHLALENIACVLITKGLTPPAEFLEAADDAALPVLQTSLVSSIAISVVTSFLETALAPVEMRHGVLIDAYGAGVLIEGESGIGKSECALDLILRGHRLVADDVVEIRRPQQKLLIGRAPEMLRELMEIRGLGIINIKDLCGVAAVGETKTIDLAIRLERWQHAREVERLGIEPRTTAILGVEVPHVLLPVSGGRNLATLVETAVRVHLLRLRGQDAARDFATQHSALLQRKTMAFAPDFGRDANKNIEGEEHTKD
ncbi:MAG: HPr(Ser) kinase/phosphatase [Pyrinomonadaceae bacterium]